MPAGGASRRRSAKTPTSSRAWASPPCAASRATATFARQDARHRHAQALRRARTARVRAELRAGERVHARAARGLPQPRSRSRFARPARSASCRRTTRWTACRRTRTAGCCATSCAAEWGFDGFTVSDYYAIWELGLPPRHARPFRRARTSGRACVLAVRAGVNIEAPEPDCYLAARRPRSRGDARASASWTTSSRRRCCGSSGSGCSTTRTSIADDAERTVGSARNRALALQAARETITLLKNDGARAAARPGHARHHRRHRA